MSDEKKLPEWYGKQGTVRNQETVRKEDSTELHSVKWNPDKEELELHVTLETVSRYGRYTENGTTKYDAQLPRSEELAESVNLKQIVKAVIDQCIIKSGSLEFLTFSALPEFGAKKSEKTSVEFKTVRSAMRNMKMQGIPLETVNAVFPKYTLTEAEYSAL